MFLLGELSAKSEAYHHLDGPMTQLTIRPLTDGDEPAVIALWRAYSLRMLQVQARPGVPI